MMLSVGLLLCAVVTLTGATTDVSSCSLSKDVGPCRRLMIRWYFNTGTETCELFQYGGCQGNLNNFETMQACDDLCGHLNVTAVAQPVLPPSDVSSCSLSKDVGPCRRLMIRWYFNTGAKECETFQYGGCQGNLNNFETLQACDDLCGHLNVTAVAQPALSPSVTPVAQPLVQN